MNEPLHFKTRNEFRIWLMNHCMSGGGVWLKFENQRIQRLRPATPWKRHCASDGLTE